MELNRQLSVADFGLRLLQLVPGIGRDAAFEAAESAWETHSRQYLDEPLIKDERAAVALKQ